MKEKEEHEGKCLISWCGKKNCPRWFRYGDSTLQLADFIGSKECMLYKKKDEGN